MAASIPTTIKHHKLNIAEPIKQDPTKFYYHFLYKALIVSIFLIILPLFPSQAPEFINQSLLTRNWELLHLLFVGIAISYGLFCRRNDGTDKENNNSKFDTAQSYVSRFLQVSSFFEDDRENETPSGDDDGGKIQTWNNYQYHRNEPVVVVAPKHSNTTRISEKPLLLPVRSLKSRVSEPCPVPSVNESNPTSVSANGSGSKSGSRRFSRNVKMEDRSSKDNNVVLPSPIPWRSESLMKLQNARLPRPNPMFSSTSLSSPKKKEQCLSSSELVAKNSEDTVKNKGFHKSSSSIPLPPPPPPPMLFKSISMKPRTSSSLNQSVSSDKEMKRSFTTSEREEKPRGLYFENNNEADEERVKRMGSVVGFAEEEKVIMGFDEDTESEDEGGGGGGGGGGGRGRKKSSDDDEDQVSDRGEEDEDEEAARKNRLGLDKRGGDDDEEGPRGGDHDQDDDVSEKGDDWEHEEIFTDDDEAVGNDPEEREDLAPEVPAPPEIKQDDDENEDEENEEEGGLSKSGKELKKLLGRANGMNESDAEDDDDDDDMDDELPPVVAPKQKDAPKEEPADNSPLKPAPSQPARGTPSTSKTSKGKRKLNEETKPSVAPPKKVKTENELKSSVKDENGPAPKSNAQPKGTPPLSSKAGSSATTASGPVSEEEIRAVLMQKTPVTTQDLVAKFKARLRSSEDKQAFAEILKRISKIQKTNGSSYVILRDR